MLPEKMSSERPIESAPLPTAKEEVNKSKREGLILILLMAVGIGILVLVSTFLMPYVNSLRGGVPDVTTSIIKSGSTSAGVITPMADKFLATDSIGSVINTGDGIARSDQITLSGYSEDSYSTDLKCLIDTLPLYCDGSPITIPGLPDGDHAFSIVDSSYGDAPAFHVFNWKTVT